MKNRKLHINRLLSVLMLLVFSIALTPWSSLHKHTPVETVHVEKEEHCTHKLHISSHVDTCLICAAHFIKDFQNVTATFQIFQQLESTGIILPQVRSAYVTLISTSLRGPPSV